MNPSLASALFSGLRSFSAPGWRASALAWLLGWGLRRAKPRKNVALDNLRRAFPEKDEAWRVAVVDEIYCHLAWSLAEYGALLKDPLRALEWCVPDEGVGFLDRCAAEGRGAVICAGHCGNWELLGAWFARKGYPFAAIVRRHDDLLMEELIDGARRTVGFSTLGKDEPMRRVVRRLKEGGFVAVLIDQRAGSEGIEVPFFGIPATTFPGAAALSRLAQVSMVPVFSFREKPFKHKIYVGAPLSCAAGSRDEEIGALMTEANLVLEKLIRRYPAQWLWLHRRWP